MKSKFLSFNPNTPISKLFNIVFAPTMMYVIMLTVAGFIIRYPILTLVQRKTDNETTLIIVQILLHLIVIGYSLYTTIDFMKKRETGKYALELKKYQRIISYGIFFCVVIFTEISFFAVTLNLI